VNIDTISRCFDSAMKYGNALPAISLNESVRIAIAGGNKPIDRKNIYLIQTPQVFSVARIKEAYKQKYKPEFTDDATVFETLGEKINIVKGDILNIKLTTSIDMEFAETVLKRRSNLPKTTGIQNR
jgi:2-C-methyl-D-erythritol 4-phosphate cytidylyltransferase